MSGSRRVETDAWVAELRALREDGWVVFDWLGVVEEPGDAPGEAPGGASYPGAPGLRLVVQLLRPRNATAAGDVGAVGDVGDGAHTGDAGGKRAGYGRLQIHTRIPPGGSAPSLTGLWPGAAWHEREAWEMFGLAFDGFTDHTGAGLRPLLLDGLDGPDGPGGGGPGAEMRSTAGGPEPSYPPPLRKAVLLPARTGTPWPGAVEPGESPSDAAVTADGGPGAAAPGARRGSRRRQRPLGVPSPAPAREDMP